MYEKVIDKFSRLPIGIGVPLIIILYVICLPVAIIHAGYISWLTLVSFSGFEKRLVKHYYKNESPDCVLVIPYNEQLSWITSMNWGAGVLLCRTSDPMTFSIFGAPLAKITFKEGANPQDYMVPYGCDSLKNILGEFSIVNIVNQKGNIKKGPHMLVRRKRQISSCFVEYKFVPIKDDKRVYPILTDAITRFNLTTNEEHIAKRYDIFCFNGVMKAGIIDSKKNKITFAQM